MNSFTFILVTFVTQTWKLEGYVTSLDLATGKCCLTRLGNGDWPQKHQAKVYSYHMKTVKNVIWSVT